ncbi:hypothetical protein BABINDRAFT_165467 [Babjeviella inositovora NRRL Y-12698]|uniref:Hsp70 nucleotide exchange factor FES1 n=1 Tax=Babjeviella inositovora NRRL Y-12698 TaxID=984486 RepID=A0A1E3QWA7_9ASCO|nr:uncharacterized protein BABINDRAFT_165467 [Babjeviella inositovora NRRL Y-12698]ODQ81959.1 hypothetical protein BABINDRAFT_165467 [Babjeviella inositovora NRRL Y-12698]
MEKILQWSIAANSGDQETLEKLGQPDPEQMARLFGAAGPDEPTLMKQNMTVMLHPEATLENKEVAFDNFEMLIENLDNANNIENMKLWPSVISQLTNEEPSLRRYAASIVGTAVQNNPDCQNNYIKHDNALTGLLKLASEEEKDTSVRLKGLYALSSLVRNNEAIIGKFSEAKGWAVVSPILNSSELKDNVKLRALSLLSALLSLKVDEEAIREIQDGEFIKHITSFITPDGHMGCLDKSLNLISLLASYKYPFLATEVAAVTRAFKGIEGMKDQLSEDDYQNVKQVTL